MATRTESVDQSSIVITQMLPVYTLCPIPDSRRAVPNATSLVEPEAEKQTKKKFNVLPRVHGEQVQNQIPIHRC